MPLIMIAFMIMRCLSNNISYMHVNSRKGRVLQQSAVQCEYLVVGGRHWETGRAEREGSEDGRIVTSVHKTTSPNKYLTRN